MDISFWNYDSVPSCKSWLVNKVDLNDFEVVSELFHDYPVFIIDRDNPDCSIAIVYTILCQIKNNDLKDFNILSLPEYQISLLIHKIFSCLKNYDIQEAFNHCQQLSKIVDGQHAYDKLIVTLDMLVDINKIFFNDILNSSVYGYMKKRAFWYEIPHLKNIIDSIKTECNKAPSCIYGLINSKIRDICEICDILSGRDVVEKFKIISAFCYSFSIYFMNKSCHMQAFMLIHRSLDFYFVADAVCKGYIEVKRDHLRYHNQSYSNDEGIPRIYLYKTYFNYIATFDKLSNESEESIRLINKKRNELLLAHGVNSVNKKDVEDAYASAGKIMKVDENWRNYSAKFRTRFIIDQEKVISSLYKIDDIIQPYIVYLSNN